MGSFKEIFSLPIAPPCSYNITFDGVENTQDLFNTFFDIYKNGCVFLFGTQGSFDLSTLDENKRFTIKQYMRSIGILPRIWEYTRDQVHDIFVVFEKELRQISKTVHIMKKMDSQHRIRAINFSFRNKSNSALIHYLKQLQEVIKDNDDFINVLNITIDKNVVSNYKVVANIGERMYVLRFFFENQVLA